jgi:hypothetical protein
MELRIQLRREYHVFGTLCVHTRDLPNKGQGNWQRVDSNIKSSFWYHGCKFPTVVMILANTLQPIIAMFANLRTAVPVYISGALFLLAGLLVAALPFESQGKASL